MGHLYQTIGKLILVVPTKREPQEIIDLKDLPYLSTSCPVERINKSPTVEYCTSVRFTNPSGIHATCVDNHVLEDLRPMICAKVMVRKDIHHELVGSINNVEKFEARRWHHANVVRNKMMATDSRECRSCHSFSSKDYQQQDRRIAPKNQRAEAQRKTYIACHKGTAHTELLPQNDNTGNLASSSARIKL